MRYLPAFARTVLVLLLSMLASQSGVAQQPLPDAPVSQSPSVRAWQGAYVGIAGGYAFARSSTSDGGTVIANPPYGAFSCGPALTGNYCGAPFLLDTDGTVGSLLASLNWQWGRVVAGFEADVSSLDVGATKTLLRPFNDRDFLSVHYDWSASVTARLGYAIGESLIYAKGGVAVVNVRTIAADIDRVGGKFGIYPGSLATSSGVIPGLTLGGGIEHALNRSFVIRAEYMLTMLERERSRSPDGDIYRHDHELAIFRLGLTYRLPGATGPSW